MHVSHLPVAGEKPVPAGQLKQEDDPIAANSPSGHALHESLPSTAKVFGGHLDSIFEEFVVTHLCPSLHGRHDVKQESKKLYKYRLI